MSLPNKSLRFTLGAIKKRMFNKRSSIGPDCGITPLKKFRLAVILKTGL